MPQGRVISLALAVIAAAALTWAAAAGRGEAQQPVAGRYAVATGANFGLVVDQSTGQVWRCGNIDVKCDRLRLETK